MNLSDGEKLILWMLSEIYDRMGIEDGVNAAFVREAIGSGNTWALKWELPGVFVDASDPEVPVEASRIMNMWQDIELAYEELAPDDRAELKRRAGPFGCDPKFPGFDGNHEGDYLSAARIMIEHMDRFRSFAGRGLNSHSTVIPGYRRMLEAYGRVRDKLAKRTMGVDELVSVLQAQAHPSHMGAD